MTYQEYMDLVKIYEERDSREIIIQNRIIIPFLDSVFEAEKLCSPTKITDEESIWIVDISTQYKNTNSKKANHTREYYAWQYTPDILIAKNWYYSNKNNSNIKYLTVVEIKSVVQEPNFEKHQHTIDELSNYLDRGGKENLRVILTDCKRWWFFDPTNEETKRGINKKNESIYDLYPQKVDDDKIGFVLGKDSEIDDSRLKKVNEGNWKKFKDEIREFCCQKSKSS